MASENKSKVSILTNGIIKENPVLRLVLGTCSCLAVTTAVSSALGMGAAFTFVLVCSNILISLLRNVIPAKVHLPCYIVIIAGFVTIVQMVMHAYMDSLYTALGVFLPLIVVNCIILGRAEMFACKNNVVDSALDGIGMGIGYTLTVVLMASIVFAGLSSLGQERGDDFLLNWSAILGAGTTFALPLCWGMPFSRLARHFHKAGCAVAGWCGAEKISRRRAMILTDGDLFPPGTIQLNGVKVFGEDLSRVSSYAASMARAADCGLQRLFDGLLRSEGGHYEKVDDFSFYEEGGYSATIRGESVLLGTASFMRKMEVRLPGGINLRTGIFLAMDRQLAAVFAVKYQPSENVDFALRMMRRSRITPILASRDPNITPALLKRKFHKGVKVEFPSLTDRVAFSEAELDRGMPRALLFREGLLPYAEAVVGSRRLCKAVRRATALSVLGSVAGTLLSFYMVFQGAYNLLTPLALLVFLLLWALPVLLLADWAGRY